MIVLGYPREMRNGSIDVPPYQTGPLGFVQGTDLVSRLFEYETYADRRIGPNLQLLFTAYQPPDEGGALARFQCYLQDRPGVVQKVVSTLADIDVNIVIQESADYLNKHLLNMILDLSTVDISDAGLKNCSSYYRDYQSLCPVANKQCMRVIEALVINCGEALSWESEENDYPRPRIQLWPIPSAKSKGPPGRSVVKPNPDEALKRHAYASVPVDEHQALAITRRFSGRRDTTDHLTYITTAHTGDRALRVFFPNPTIAKRIMHVRFDHEDKRGMLAAMTATVADAGFNILSSLLRKSTLKMNSWEAILEYRKGDLPNAKDPSARSGVLKQVAEWLREAVSDNDRDNDNATNPDGDYDWHEPLEFTLNWPRFPKRTADADVSGERIVFHRRRSPEGSDRVPDGTLPPTAQSADFLSHDLHRRVARRLQAVTRVFLSYPQLAQPHADLLRMALRKHFINSIEVDTYVDKDGQDIKREVIRRINECEMLIAVWHHEDRISNNGIIEQLSPWMPFELGIAMTLGKSFYVAASRKLNPELYLRLIPERAILTYSDLEFQSETIPQIVKRVTHLIEREPIAR